MILNILRHTFYRQLRHKLFSTRTPHTLSSYHTDIICAIFSPYRKIPHIPSPCLFRMLLYLTPPRHFLAYPNFWQWARVLSTNRKSDCPSIQFCTQPVFLSRSSFLHFQFSDPRSYPIHNAVCISHSSCLGHLPSSPGQS